MPCRFNGGSLHHTTFEAIVPFLGSLVAGHFDAKALMESPAVAANASDIIADLTRNMCKAYAVATTLPYATVPELEVSQLADFEIVA